MWPALSFEKLSVRTSNASQQRLSVCLCLPAYLSVRPSALPAYEFAPYSYASCQVQILRIASVAILITIIFLFMLYNIIAQSV